MIDENLNNSRKRLELAITKRFDTKVTIPDETPNIESLALLNERSVCRSYQSKPLGENLVKLICATALSSPSKSDLQQASIIRLRSDEKRAAVDKLLPNSTWIHAAPELLIICGDHSRINYLFESRDLGFPNNHLDTFFNAAVDGGIVLANLVQAAQFAGLGACPVSEIRDHCKEISKILELPKYVFPIAGVTIGYPVVKEPITPRLGLGTTLHQDRYDTSCLNSELVDYDKRRIESRPYDAQREINKYGRHSQYSWSEDKFRQYSVIQREDFGAFIRDCGFKLD